MGATPSKETVEESRRLGLSTSLTAQQYSFLIQRTQCAEALPPLPPPGATPPPPPPDEPKAKQVEAPPPPPPSNSSSSEAMSIADAAASVGRNVPNPGPYEQAAQDAKRLVMLDTYDGFRVDINKQLSPYMAVVHSFWLGTTMIPDGRTKTYSFLAQVADEQGLLMARVDPGRGSVDGRIHRAIGPFMTKVQLGLSTEGQNDQVLCEADFGGPTWTANLKYGSMGNGLVYGLNYFQSLTPKWALGGEGMYLAANSRLLSSYSVKYNTAAINSDTDEKSMETPSTFIANYNTGQQALTLNYKRVVTTNRVVLGAELQCSPFSLESQVLVGAEFKFARSKMQVCVDGSGKIQSTLETKLGVGQGTPTLNFSADVDHLNDQLRFGYGINIEG